MSFQWPLQEARYRFEEVIDHAQDDGPQTVLREGELVAVVLSIDEYRKLARRNDSLFEFLRNSPLRGVELDLERPRY
jgi:prevent-host-death family protein